MKPLLFIAYTAGSIYASLRWEWAGYALAFLFLTGAVAMVFYAMYRHLAANRLL
jgi:hypothetical protein